MNPFFSIITINLNNAEGLRLTVDSVFAQSFSDFEYIIIDGGSTDKSPDVISDAADRLAFYVSEKDNGIYDAMNKGINAAKGRYVLFLNSGDFLFNNDVLKDVYESEMNCDIVYGDVMLMKNKKELRIKTYPDHLTNYYLLTDNVAHQSQFISRDLFKKHGLYDLSYKVVADYEFFVRAYYKHHVSVKHIDKVITAYNLDGFSAGVNVVLQLNKERHRAQKLYMNSFLTFLYRMYYKLLNSSVYKLPLVKRCADAARDIIFKLIKRS